MKKLIFVLGALIILFGCNRQKATNNPESLVVKDDTQIITVEEEYVRFIEKESQPEIACNGGYLIKVNRLANCVTIYTKDKTGEFTVPVKAMACSVGLDDGTPLGTYATYQEYEWRELFGNCYGQYTTRFYNHYLFHSVPYKTINKDTLLDGEFNKLGTDASKGCVRLSVADAKWIYDNCDLGTIVEIYDDVCPGPLGKPYTIKVADDSPFAGWDPTDPDVNNPWHNKLPVITGTKNIIVKRNCKVDLFAYVKGCDYDGQPLIVIANDINTSVCGTYEVVYQTTGKYGATIYETATITVVEELEKTK